MRGRVPRQKYLDTCEWPLQLRRKIRMLDNLNSMSRLPIRSLHCHVLHVNSSLSKCVSSRNIGSNLRLILCVSCATEAWKLLLRSTMYVILDVIVNIYASAHILYQHVKTLHPDLFCEICGVGCQSVEKLEGHYRSSDIGLHPPCDVCGQAFKNEADLDKV